MVQTKMDSPPFDLQAYEPPISLWRLVEQYVSPHEREEVKNMLGESLIDQSIELHLEIDTLLDIWRDYREETETCEPVKTLAEPPGVRERLIQEIQFYVVNVKEKAKDQGVNPDKILSRHNTDVLDYALDIQRPESARPSSRQMTARLTDGRETPMITSPTDSDRISAASTFSEEVESMNDQLTVLRFDEVATHLRSTLEEEVETLMKDINFLQNCLDEEATFRAEFTGALSREPTLTDLREERTGLEKDLLSNIKSQASPPLKNAFTPPLGMKNLGPSLNTGAKVKVGTNNSSSLSPVKKPGPMRAFTASDTPGATSDVHVGSAGSRSGSARSIRTPKDKTHKTVPSSDSHQHSRSDTMTSSIGKRDSASSGTGSRVDSGRIRSLRAGRSYKDQEDRLAGSDTSERSHNTPAEGASRTTLGAIVTLSRGKSGDSPEMKVLSSSPDGMMIPSPPAMRPSPPPSAKPMTPRPSSAQRFRKMVQDCRD